MCKISQFGDRWKEELDMALTSLVAQTVKHLRAMWGTWVGKIPWRRKWQPTPVKVKVKSLNCLKNSMDEGAWQAIVHGIAKSRTQLSSFFAFKGDFNPVRVTDWREYTKRIQRVNKMEAGRGWGTAEGELRREGYSLLCVVGDVF